MKYLIVCLIINFFSSTVFAARYNIKLSVNLGTLLENGLISWQMNGELDYLVEVFDVNTGDVLVSDEPYGDVSAYHSLFPRIYKDQTVWVDAEELELAVRITERDLFSNDVDQIPATAFIDESQEMVSVVYLNPGPRSTYVVESQRLDLVNNFVLLRVYKSLDSPYYSVFEGGRITRANNLNASSLLSDNSNIGMGLTITRQK